MVQTLRPALALLVLLSLLTGVAYPCLVSLLAALLWPGTANGSLVSRAGVPVGSALVGQPFDDPACFWGRPSATGPFPANAAASSGSNLGPTNPALLEAVRARIAILRAADPGRAGAPVPADLVTASGSGLDPHISPAAAAYQLPRVAASRPGLGIEELRALVAAHTEGRTLGVLGEPRVNVLLLNLALDARAPRTSR